MSLKNKVKEIVFGRSGIHKIRFGIGVGLKMDIDPSSKTQRILGLDEYEISKYFRLYAKTSTVFIDIGASDGYYGLIFRKLNPKGKVFLFDAQEVFYEEQKTNFELNNTFDENINLHSKFVADFDDDKHVSIDNLMKKSNVLDSDVLMIKIDVDGGEIEVLKGLSKTLINYKCQLIIETHSKDLEVGCLEFVKEIGYKTEIIDNGKMRVIIPETRPIEHNRWFIAYNN